MAVHIQARCCLLRFCSRWEFSDTSYTIYIWQECTTETNTIWDKECSKSLSSSIYIYIYIYIRNDFQDKLKEDINKICSSKNLFVFADKSTNLYKISDTEYNKLLSNNITSNYRKCENGVKQKTDKDPEKIVESLDLSKKMECYASCPAFITIKDYYLFIYLFLIYLSLTTLGS